MSEEQKSMDKLVNTAPGGNNGRKRGRFTRIIIAAAGLFAVLIGVGIYNTPANRMSRHLDLGARYLEEQNYEQAIVEFNQVIAIDLMSVDAYLGKAQAYEGMGDIEKAIETLQTSYEKTRDERVKEAVGDCLTDYIERLIEEERYDEVKALIEKYRDKVPGVDFQAYLDEIEKLTLSVKWEKLLKSVPEFDISDVRIMGYDLQEPRMKEILKALGYTEVYDGYFSGFIKLQDGVYESISESGVALWMDTGHENIEESMSLAWDYYEDGEEGLLSMNKINGKETEALSIGLARCDLPLSIGDSYEKWCQLLETETLKENSIIPTEEKNIFDKDLGMNHTMCTYVVMADDVSQENNEIVYWEDIYEKEVRCGESDNMDEYMYDYDMIAGFETDVQAGSLSHFRMEAFFKDRTVQHIYYSFRWRT